MISRCGALRTPAALGLYTVRTPYSGSRTGWTRCRRFLIELAPRDTFVPWSFTTLSFRRAPSSLGVSQEVARQFAKTEMIPVAAQYDKSGEYPHDVFKKAWEVRAGGLSL
jgi:hypothetical protein